MIVKSDSVVKFLNFVRRSNFDGYTVFFIIFVRANADQGLIAHEKVHVRQFWRTFGLFPILYCFTKYRLKFEAEAYKASIEHGMSKHKALMLLSTQYKLKTSLTEIEKALS